MRSHPDTLAAYRDYWGARNPYIQSRHPFARTEGAIVTGRQPVPDAILRRTPFYQEFLCPMVRRLNRLAKEILDQSDSLEIVSGQVVAADPRANRERLPDL